MNDTIQSAREYAAKAACDEAMKRDEQLRYDAQQGVCTTQVGPIGMGYLGDAVKATSSRFTVASALETMATDLELKAKRLRALYAALPREMSHDAETALADLITKFWK